MFSVLLLLSKLLIFVNASEFVFFCWGGLYLYCVSSSFLATFYFVSLDSIKSTKSKKIHRKYCPNSMFLQRLLRSLALAADEEANRGFLNNNAEFFCLASIFLFILTLTESCNEGFKLDLGFFAYFHKFQVVFFSFPQSF